MKTLFNSLKRLSLGTGESPRGALGWCDPMPAGRPQDPTAHDWGWSTWKRAA